mgnify:CR=1 FL=1
MSYIRINLAPKSKTRKDNSKENEGNDWYRYCWSTEIEEPAAVAFGGALYDKEEE